MPTEQLNDLVALLRVLRQHGVTRYVGPDGLQLDLELVAPVSKPETPREGGEGALAERFFPKARGTT